jgi:hypothetical protein
MDKYYIGKATIDGERRETAHTLSNFRGTPEEAVEVIAATNPGLEDLEITENGDSERGMVALPKPPATDKDFAKAMMSPPRTVRVGPTKPNAPSGPFDPAAGGIKREAVPPEEYAKLTGGKK